MLPIAKAKRRTGQYVRRICHVLGFGFKLAAIRHVLGFGRWLGYALRSDLPWTTWVLRGTHGYSRVLRVLEGTRVLGYALRSDEPLAFERCGQQRGAAVATANGGNEWHSPTRKSVAVAW